MLSHYVRLLLQSHTFTFYMRIRQFDHYRPIRPRISASSLLQSQVPLRDITPDSQPGKLAQIRIQNLGRAVLQDAVSGIRPDTPRSDPKSSLPAAR